MEGPNLQNFFSKKMTKNIFRNWLKRESSTIFVSQALGYKKKRRNFYFLTSHILDKYTSAISLNKILPCSEGIQPSFLTVYRRELLRGSNDIVFPECRAPLELVASF